MRSHHEHTHSRLQGIIWFNSNILNINRSSFEVKIAFAEVCGQVRNVSLSRTIVRSYLLTLTVIKSGSTTPKKAGISYTTDHATASPQRDMKQWIPDLLRQVQQNKPVQRELHRQAKSSCKESGIALEQLL